MDWEQAISQRIGDPDPAVRRAALAEATSLGLAVADVEALLGDADPLIRIRAVGLADRAEVVVPSLGDPDGRVRAFAAGALWRLGGKAYRDAIWPLLADDEPCARQAAFLALLGRRSEKDTSTPPLSLAEVPDDALDALLSHREPGVRRCAVEALGRRRGQRPFEVLVGFLDDPAGEVRAAALAALRDLYWPNLAEVALPLLGDTDPEVRQRALDGVEDPEAIAPLVSDPDSGVRRQAAYRLAKVTDKGRALEAVAPHFADADPGRRGDALLFLRDLFLDEEADRAAALLGDTDAGVRALACTALGTIGNASHAGAVTALLDDSDPAVQREALDALRCIGEGFPLEDVIPFLCHEDGSLAFEAEQCILDRVRVEDLERYVGDLGTASAVWRAGVLEAVAIVARREQAASTGGCDPLDLCFETECVAFAPEEGEGDEARWRREALEAMAPVIEESLAHTEAPVRAAGLRALGRIGRTTSVALVEARLSDPEARVRGEAILAVHRLGGRIQGDLLARFLRDPCTAEASASVAGSVDDADQEAAIVPLLSDPDPGIRIAGVRAAAAVLRASRDGA